MKHARLSKTSSKSSIRFERLPDRRLGFNALFTTGVTAYEVSGAIDARHQRVEPFQHRFTLGRQRVFDSVVALGDHAVRSEFAFGPATAGIRTLNLKTERLRRGVLVTGAADGAELLPVLAAGCSCDVNPASTRPILVWGEGEAVQPITVSLRSAKAGDEIGPLAGVVRSTIDDARRGGFGGLGDLGDQIDDVLCVLECVGSYLLCLLRSIFTPGGNIVLQLCTVVGGGSCIDDCTFFGTLGKL